MPAESWISAGIYRGFLDWESEARVSCLREWSNSKVQMTSYREKKQGRESKTVPFKAWNKGPVWIIWTSHGSQNQAVQLRSIWFTVFFHGTVLHVKQTVKIAGLRFFRLDRTVLFGFQNHALFSRRGTSHRTTFLAPYDQTSSMDH